MTFNLFEEHFLLLASGRELGENSIGEHFELRAYSDYAVNLTVPANVVPGERSVLILVHGSLMIVAWIGLTSIGIVFARYFKKSWTNHKICGKDVWFFWHFICMSLTWVLTITAYIIIFVDLGQWRTTVHSVAGTVTLAFAFVQPIGGIFRPHPTAKGRPVFNFMHFCFGNVTHTLAIITIFFAVPLISAEIPYWTTYVLVAFVSFYLLMHIIFSVSLIVWCAVKILINIFIPDDFSMQRNEGRQTSDGKQGTIGELLKCLTRIFIDLKRVLQYQVLSKTLFGFFVLTILLFVIALILIIGLAEV